MSELPVREMVLYKHGVGFFVRSGAVEGDAATLTFKADEINDVLKSLAVFDRSGGHILGLHYQTPMDRHSRLASSSIKLNDNATLTDLIRQLRGRRITVQVEDAPGSTATISGRMVGVDNSYSNRRDYENLITVSVLTDDGSVRVIRIENLRDLKIDDGQAEHDLSYFLDTSMAEDARRTVTVRLSEGTHDLAVFYVAPTPTWRVSYRLVAETDEDGTTGKAVLQGWGLFDNRLDEDLEDVQVTLVAGQPISFIYDLYASRIPKRPTVRDEARVAPGPIEFEGTTVINQEMPDALYAASELDPMADRQKFEAAKTRGGLLGRIETRKRSDNAEGVVAFGSMPMREEAVELSMGDLRDEDVADTRDTGETFQYKVTAPVSVKRGESALVPIINSDVSYNRELLYNRDKFLLHPVAALRFVNNSGLTLERGPVTVVEDGDYKGEAVVAFTKDDNEVYLPYAVELGVRVTEKTDQHYEDVGLSIEGSYGVYEQHYIVTATFTLENKTNQPKSVLVEVPNEKGFDLFDTPEPEVETGLVRRWRVEVAAGAKTDFTAKFRQLSQRREILTNFNFSNLTKIMENQWLDSETFDKLREMLVTQQSVKTLIKEKKKLEDERESIYKQQDQLRRNLNALQPTGKEAALRDDVLENLSASQNRLNEVNRAITQTAEDIKTAEARVQEIVSSF